MTEQGKAPTRLLIIGCGDIGGGVAEHFVQRGWQVQGLRRNTALLPFGVAGLSADLSKRESVGKLGKLGADYVLFTLTPAAYTAEGYRVIFEEAVAQILTQLERPARLFFVSSSGVYDQSGHEWVDEDSATTPSRFSGQSLLAGEQRVKAFGCPHSIVRFTGIYGPGRVQMLSKVVAGECAPEHPVHYTNRIHRDDCVGFLCHLIDKADRGEPLHDCYLGSDDTPSSIQEVQHWLAEQLGVAYRQEGAPVARTGSKRCDNRRLRESGYTLLHPDYRSGFRGVVEEFRGR